MCKKMVMAPVKVFSWTDWGKLRKTPIKIARKLVEIRN